MASKHPPSLEGLNEEELKAHFDATWEQVMSLSDEELDKEIDLVCREMGISREEWDRRDEESFRKIQARVLEARFGKPQGNA